MSHLSHVSLSYWKWLTELRLYTVPDTLHMDDTFLDVLIIYTAQTVFLLVTSENPETTATLADVIRRSSRASAHVALRMYLFLRSVISLHEGDAKTCRLLDGIAADIQTTAGICPGLLQHLVIFLTSIVNISKSLSSISDRTARSVDLVHMLEGMNPFFSHELCYIPTTSNTAQLRRVLRFVSTDCAVFNTRERAPYMLLVEVQVLLDAKCADLGRVDVAGVPTPTASPRASPQPTKPILPPLSIASPLEVCYGLTFADNKERLRKASPMGDMLGWDVDCYIVKHGDNLVQEALAMQLIGTVSAIWNEAHLPLKLTPYQILIVTHEAGLIECVTDAKTIDSIKKTSPPGTTLCSHFQRVYGDPTSRPYRDAQRNFIESCAGYSVLCYLLQIKDRHNGNILLKRDGTVVHIDFGFMLTTSPGGWNFENVPFKLPIEYADVMGPDGFAFFKLLVFMGLQHLRRHSERITSLVEMADGRCVPCLGADTRNAAQCLRERFLLFMTESEFMRRVKDMIDLSLDNWRTRGYDTFQRMQNGIEH